MAKKRGKNTHTHTHTHTHIHIQYQQKVKATQKNQMANGDFGTEKLNNIKKGLSTGFSGPVEGKEKRISEQEDKNKIMYLI